MAKSQTCNDVPDGFYKSIEGRNFRLPVLPHGLPDDKATSQAECQVRLLKRETEMLFPVCKGCHFSNAQILKKITGTMCSCPASMCQLKGYWQYSAGSIHVNYGL